MQLLISIQFDLVIALSPIAHQASTLTLAGHGAQRHRFSDRHLQDIGGKRGRPMFGECKRGTGREEGDELENREERGSGEEIES